MSACRDRPSRASRSSALAVSGPSSLFAGQQPSCAGLSRAAQAAAGRAAYQANCASCHFRDLGGRNEAPPLAGPNFMSAWGTRTTRICSTTCQRDDAAGRGDADRRSVRRDRGVRPAVERRGGGAPGVQRQRRRYRSRAIATGRAPAAKRRPGRQRVSRRRARTGAGGVGRGGRRGRGPAVATAAARRRPWRGGAGARRAGSRRGRSEELRAGHRRDAAQSRSRRLADGAPQLSGLELQPAQRDHARQRQGSQARLGLVDERGAAPISRCRSCTTASCIS